MSITASQVRKLREQTAAPLMACKKALQKTAGNLEEAILVLRKSGKAKAEKRSRKIAAEGKTELLVTDDNKRAFMVEINSETDFVARDCSFNDFAKLLARRGLSEKVQHVSALLALPEELGSKQTIEQLRQCLITKTGENIQVRRVAYLRAENCGCVVGYCHAGRISVLLSLLGGDSKLAKDIAMHIAAMNPQAISPDDISDTVIENERAIFMERAQQSRKSEAIVHKIVDGQLKKFFKENTLLDQPFVKDNNHTVAELLKIHKASIKNFVRFEVGEGIEKKYKTLPTK